MTPATPPETKLQRTMRRLVASLAAVLVAVFAASCAGGPRPVLVETPRESAKEVAEALPDAPPTADIDRVLQATAFHPTETDAIAQWARESDISFAGDCLVSQIPDAGALCGTERSTGVWIMGQGANQPWYVLDIENAPAGFRVVNTHLAGGA